MTVWAAAAKEVETGRQFALDGLTVLVLAVAVADIAPQTGKGLVDHQIDHAGHGIGAPLGRCAAGHHVDAFDDVGRQGGKVDAADGGRVVGIGIGRDHALAVEQHQGTHHAQVAQVDGVDTGVTLRRVTGVGAVAGRVGNTDRRQFADGVADVHLGVALQGFNADHGDRRGRLIALDLNAGGRNRDFSVCGSCACAVVEIAATMAAIDPPNMSFLQRFSIGPPKACVVVGRLNPYSPERFPSG
jgi:hypothetical protein